MPEAVDGFSFALGLAWKKELIMQQPALGNATDSILDKPLKLRRHY
jgi:hypothetical protein